MTPTGTLHLLPVPLGLPPEEADLKLWAEALTPPPALPVIHTLRHFVVEQSKTARRILKLWQMPVPISSLQLQELNEHTAAAAMAALLQPLFEGHDVGLLSEAGCPAIADPGAQLVRLAHERGVSVKPWQGPSSLILALMASGCCGQRFRFLGYIPSEAAARGQALRALEQRSAEQDEAQIFIETPYRNSAMLDSLLQHLQPQTWLVSATDLTLPDASIQAGTVQQWRQRPRPNLHKRPTVFVLQAPFQGSTRAKTTHSNA